MDSVVDPCLGKADSTGLALLWEKPLPFDGIVKLMKVTEHGLLILNKPYSAKFQQEIMLLDTKSGSAIWKKDYPELIIIDNSVILGDYFYFAQLEKLFRLDIRTGQIENVFTYEPFHFLTVIPNSLDESIFIKSNYYDKNAGADEYQVLEFKTETLEHSIIQDTLDIEDLTTNSDFYKKPVFTRVNGKRIMCFSWIDVTQYLIHFTSINIDSGKMLWEKSYTIADQILSTGLNSQFYLSDAATLTSIDPLTGKENWKTAYNYSLGGSVHFVNNSIFFLGKSNISKIDQSTGIPIWKQQINIWTEERPAYFKDQVYFIGQDALQACDFSGGCLTTRTLNPYFDNDGQRRYFSELDIDPESGLLLLSDNAHIFGYELPK